MTKADKRAFIKSMMRSIEGEMLKAVPRMPDAWDGHELRAYMALRFAWGVECGEMTGSRKRNFHNTIIVENL